MDSGRDGHVPPKKQSSIAIQSHSNFSRHSFSFRNASSVEVLDAANSIKSNDIGLDGIPLRFLKLTFPMILPFLTLNS